MTPELFFSCFFSSVFFPKWQCSKFNKRVSQCGWLLLFGWTAPARGCGWLVEKLLSLFRRRPTPRGMFVSCRRSDVFCGRILLVWVDGILPWLHKLDVLLVFFRGPTVSNKNYLFLNVVFLVASFPSLLAEPPLKRTTKKFNYNINLHHKFINQTRKFCDHHHKSSVDATAWLYFVLPSFEANESRFSRWHSKYKALTQRKFSLPIHPHLTVPRAIRNKSFTMSSREGVTEPEHVVRAQLR